MTQADKKTEKPATDKADKPSLKERILAAFAEKGIGPNDHVSKEQLTQIFNQLADEGSDLFHNEVVKPGPPVAKPHNYQQVRAVAADKKSNYFN